MLKTQNKAIQEFRRKVLDLQEEVISKLRDKGLNGNKTTNYEVGDFVRVKQLGNNKYISNKYSNQLYSIKSLRFNVAL